MWQYYNPNPEGRAVGDCAVRAVAKALDTDWDTAYELIAEAGFKLKNIMSSNSVWGSVLRRYGFYRSNIPNTCPDCYTFEDFAEDHPHGVFVLGTGTHAATVKNGIIYDAWDSSQELVIYVWYRKD